MAKVDARTVEILSSVISANRISSEDEAAKSYGSAGLFSGKKPLAVVKPSSPAEVHGLIRAARDEKLNLVLASSTPPGFHGGTVPQSDAVVVDMSGMDRIVRMDRRN
ncbi:MAG: FAD-binding oxidoreductase, partial [Actinobacteria bacterium]|nr:FAD-binding oxidoreductase [Actinomycetota bacterium]